MDKQNWENFPFFIHWMRLILVQRANKVFEERIM